MEIVVAGDFCLQERLARKKDIGFVSESLLCVIKNSDISIVNLEAPVITAQEPSPRPKQGPSLSGGDNVIPLIKSLGFSCISMANNHIMDYGESALFETIELAKKNGLNIVGVGGDLEDASCVLYLKRNEVKIAVISCCEHEFSIAADNKAGANPLNPLRQYYQIQEAKTKADYVVMIIHGGVEHYQYPTKRMVQTYRFFVDVGADVVINHHQHCPCGYEKYNGKPIYYGLGNFCFDWKGKRESMWNIGYLVVLNIEDKHHIESRIVPYRQCDHSPTIEALEGSELNCFYKMMEGLSASINVENELVEKLNKFNQKNDFLYRKMLEPYSGSMANRLYRKGLLPSTISRERILALMDFIVCESHYERVKEYLNRQYKFFFNE